MKNHLYTWALILVMGSGYAFTQSQYPGQNPPAVPQTQQPPTQQPPTTDQGTADQTKASGGDVQKDIQTALQKDQSLSSANISVQANAKNVELSGSVPTQAAKDRAEQIASQNSGGLPIKNNITVESSGPASPK